MIDVAREERYRRMPVMTMMISLSEKVGLSVFGSGGFRTLHVTQLSALSLFQSLTTYSTYFVHCASPQTS